MSTESGQTAPKGPSAAKRHSNKNGNGRSNGKPEKPGKGNRGSKSNRAKPLVPIEKGLSTFLGVFTPSLLTILGVVLFLRTGWMVGNVGLLPALSIVVLAHIITLATALSVSAIATNMKVGAGGAYYMISRSLGLEIGGAVGVPLFLAQTFSLTLYAFGLAEGLQLVWPDLPQRPVAAITILVVSLVSGRSAKLALRAQVPIMVAVALAILSLLIGASRTASATLPLWAEAASGVVPEAGPMAGYWVVFAVFFPAVTGLMAGVAMSGDLADPARSIPRGTMYAVVVGFAVYMIVPIALAVAADTPTLINNSLVWLDIAIVPALILPGLFGAILSSAIGSMLGAPRTLEALINDRVLPRLASRSRTARLASRRLGRAVPHLLSTAVALAAVGLGGLNAVAPILTMFFLTTYGVVNLVAGLEKLIGAPSFRPTINIHWSISLLGALGCLAVMFLINPLAATIAMIVEIALYRGLRRRSLSATWGDLRFGATMSLTRTLLLRLRRLPVDPRNWRPNILVFASDLHRRISLVRYASWLNQGRGILTVSHIVVGDFDERASEVEPQLREMNELLDREELVAFPEIEVADNFESGAIQIMQANGIAGVASNTIMLGWREDPERLAPLLRIARRAALVNKSTVICKLGRQTRVSKPRRIDVWWGGLQNNGDMLLLFAYLLSRNPEWSSAHIHVKTIGTSGMTQENIEKNLADLLARTRIDATATVLPRPEGKTVMQVIHEQSGDADLVFMGLQDVEKGQEDRYAERLAKLVGDLPTVLLVRAAGPFAGQLLGSEQEQTSLN